MNRLDGISGELGPYVDRHEAEAIDRVADRLITERGTLSPRRRIALRKHLASLAASGSITPDAATVADAPAVPEVGGPRRLGLAVAGTVVPGLLLLAVAAVGLAGAGPLAF
jgi:hypothetical protein